MRNILFISSLPFPQDKGSSQHALYFIRALSGQFNVFGIFFVQPGRSMPKNLHDILKEEKIVDYEICYFSRLPKCGRIRSNLRRIFAFPNPYMNQTINSENLQIIEEFIEKYQIDLVHVEHFHYTKYIFKIKSNIKKVVVYHDLYHTIYLQRAKREKKFYKKSLLYLDTVKYYMFQKLLDRFVDAKIFLNADEMARHPEKSIHIPHVANDDIVYCKPNKVNFFNIVFIGGYNHPPNISSGEYIIKKIVPLLAEKTENFKIHIVGAGTENFQSLIDSEGLTQFISIEGFVNSINDAFSNMDIALFPILYGGGIKTKTIDAMTAGVPVVTTPEGVIGLSCLPEDCIAVGKNSVELIDHIIRLMKNFSYRLLLSNNAKQYIENQNSYRIFRNRVADAYASI